MFGHEDIKHSTSTGRPSSGLESTKSCVLIPIKIEEEDQTKTVRPVKVEEHDIDFRVPGLSHAVVKEAEHLRVQELVKKIESHPHREALQADLQQNNVNPFSNNSKATWYGAGWSSTVRRTRSPMAQGACLAVRNTLLATTRCGRRTISPTSPFSVTKPATTRIFGRSSCGPWRSSRVMKRLLSHVGTCIERATRDIRYTRKGSTTRCRDFKMNMGCRSPMRGSWCSSW